MATCSQAERRAGQPLVSATERDADPTFMSSYMDVCSDGDEPVIGIVCLCKR